MKVIFAGPSLHGLHASSSNAFELRRPAAQGDIFQAVADGANVIGLIDGIYESVAAVWHKEILFALSKGVQVFGGASLGALRAAECSVFGMIGVGAIYEAFACNQLEDDAEVAVLHAPEELGYFPLSEPLVNVRATLAAHSASGFLSDEEADWLLRSAQRLFFKERTWRSIMANSGLAIQRSMEVLSHMSKNYINQKLIDAERLIENVSSAKDERLSPNRDWVFARTSLFNQLVGGEKVADSAP